MPELAVRQGYASRPRRSAQPRRAADCRCACDPSIVLDPAAARRLPLTPGDSEMRRVRTWLLMLAATCFSACGLLGPPLFLEHEFAADTPFTLEWKATGNPQQLWLRVRVTGGHDLTGPVEVSSGGKQVAAGRFSLEAEGIAGSGRSFTTM